MQIVAGMFIVGAIIIAPVIFVSFMQAALAAFTWLMTWRAFLWFTGVMTFVVSIHILFGG